MNTNKGLESKLLSLYNNNVNILAAVHLNENCYLIHLNVLLEYHTFECSIRDSFLYLFIYLSNLSYLSKTGFHQKAQGLHKGASQ